MCSEHTPGLGTHFCRKRVPMPESTDSTTELAAGKLTRAHDLRVVLQEPTDNPPVVLIEWPDQATICTPHSLQAVVTKAQHILARATIRLAQIKRDRKL
jgi:hypothetical protein